VDLIQLDDHLIISPAMKGSSVSLKTDSESVDDVKRFLLSSYVRGFEFAELTAKKKFTDEQICGARSFVRFLDERLVLSITETRIAFGRNSAGISQGSSTVQMQALLFDKGDAVDGRAHRSFRQEQEEGDPPHADAAPP